MNMQYRGGHINVIKAYKDKVWLAQFGIDHTEGELSVFVNELKEATEYKDGDSHPHDKIMQGLFN